MALENQLTIHQRVKCRFTTQLNNLIPGCETKRMENVYLHKNVGTYSEELYSPWSKRGNNPTSISWRMNTCNMAVCPCNGAPSARERNEGLKHATKWMSLGSTMLSEEAKTHLYCYCRILFIWNVQNGQMCSDRKYISGCPGLGLGRIRSDFQWIRHHDN